MIAQAWSGGALMIMLILKILFKSATSWRSFTAAFAKGDYKAVAVLNEDFTGALNGINGALNDVGATFPELGEQFINASYIDIGIEASFTSGHISLSNVGVPFTEMDRDVISFDYCKHWRIQPITKDLEAKNVSVIRCRFDYIRDNELWCDRLELWRALIHDQLSL
jgi:hypothetical protein